MACSHGYDFRYKVKLDDGAEIKPRIPFLNGRIYDTKFESQFYMISDSNKVFWYLISFSVCLDGVIRNFREFEILSNSNDCIWITFIFKMCCLDKVIGN
jgi:hypothetical protein